MEPFTEVGLLVGQGFALAFVVWLVVWGFTLPIRIFTRYLGL